MWMSLVIYCRCLIYDHHFSTYFDKDPYSLGFRSHTLSVPLVRSTQLLPSLPVCVIRCSVSFRSSSPTHLVSSVGFLYYERFLCPQTVFLFDVYSSNGTQSFVVRCNFVVVQRRLINIVSYTKSYSTSYSSPRILPSDLKTRFLQLK